MAGKSTSSSAAAKTPLSLADTFSTRCKRRSDQHRRRRCGVDLNTSHQQQATIRVGVSKHSPSWCWFGVLLTATTITLLATIGPRYVEAHGRLIEPPSRASAWRYGFQTPPNYNDHELYCGGFQRQQRNGGHCGECGDAWDVPEPRPHEYGGKWGQGVVVRRYQPSAEIALRVELTASHMGYFEFRICPELAAKQTCLDRHVLQLVGGVPSVEQPGDLTTRFYPRNGSRIYDIKGLLPEGLECANCVLQWRYIAGNNWGMCADGTGAVGCGAQEEFRACADINIGDIGPQAPLRPIRPGTGKPTTRGPFTLRPTSSSAANDTTNSTDATSATEDGDYYDSVSRLIIIVLSALLFVLCFMATIYLYTYHGQRIKQLLHWNREHKQQTPSQFTDAALGKSKTQSAALQPTLTPPPPSQISVPPVAPPRAKRLMSVVVLDDIDAHGPSVLSGTLK